MATTSKNRQALDAHERLAKVLEKTKELTAEALSEGDRLTEWVLEQATTNGMATTKATLHNAQLYLATQLAEHKRQTAVVEELGYTSFDVMAKAIRQTTGETRNRKSMTYYREVLPAWATELPVGLKRFAGQVGQPRVDRRLLNTFYPLLEEYLCTTPDEWATNSVQTAWAQCEDLTDLERVYEWVCDRLEGLDEERPNDLVPVAPLLHEIKAALGNTFGETLLQELLTNSEQENWQTDRSKCDDIASMQALRQVNWVLQEFQGTGLDTRVNRGLIACGYAVSETQLSEKVTLGLYNRCVLAVRAAEGSYESHEDAYEIVAEVVKQHENELNASPINPYYEVSDDELQECLAALSN